MSKITLSTYVLLLKRISQGEIAFLGDLKGSENRMARELLRSGLISDDEGLHEVERSVGIRSPLAITPEGIAALEAWSEQLKTQSLWYKAGDVLVYFLWMIIGAIVAQIPEIIKMITSWTFT